MPARKDIDSGLVEHWAWLYLGDGSPDDEIWSLSEIAREYNVSRGLVKARLEDAFPGITGGVTPPEDDQPGAGPTDAEPSGAPEAYDRWRNGHGDATGVRGLP